MKFKLVLLILNNRVADLDVDLLAVVSARIVGAFHSYGDTQTAALVIFKVFDKV